MFILLISLFILNIFDFISTYILLSYEHIEEGNVLMRNFMKIVGVVPAMLIMKGTSLFLWTYAYIKLTLKREAKLYIVLGSIATFVYICVMLTQNVPMLLKL